MFFLGIPSITRLTESHKVAIPVAFWPTLHATIIDERKWVDKYPFHSLQYCILRYMDDFGITNAIYFQDMYRDIYPEEIGIRLIPNRVKFKADRLVECKLLHTLVFMDMEGTVHVTLYDKREDYDFFVNRFPDIASNACKI
jgi:hypothetical protein